MKLDVQSPIALLVIPIRKKTTKRLLSLVGGSPIWTMQAELGHRIMVQSQIVEQEFSGRDYILRFIQKCQPTYTATLIHNRIKPKKITANI